MSNERFIFSFMYIDGLPYPIRLKTETTAQFYGKHKPKNGDQFSKDQIASIMKEKRSELANMADGIFMLTNVSPQFTFIFTYDEPADYYLIDNGFLVLQKYELYHGSNIKADESLNIATNNISRNYMKLGPDDSPYGIGRSTDISFESH